MVVQEDLHHLRLLQSGDSLITSPAQPMIDAWPPLTRTPHSRRLVNPLDDVTPAVSADDDDAASMPSTPHSVFRPFPSPDPLETASPSPSSFSVASTNRSYPHRRRPPLNFSSLTPTSFNASPPASSTSTLPLTPLPFERWTPQTPSSPLNSPFTLPNTPTPGPPGHKQYDYLLKFLLVGDSDVGKQEILSGLDDGGSEMVFCSGPAHKTTTILLDGKRVRLELWDTSGQGRFCTIIRSYSRGAQGILLVYDITNKWSFDGLDRWLREVEEHAPGVPKVLVGNRLHLEFKRAVSPAQAEAYAVRHDMAFFEVSPLCDYNIAESFAELSRRALRRNGMERLWRANKVLSLQELCCRTIVNHTTVYGIERLPLPPSLKCHLKSYALSGTSYRTRGRALMASQSKKHKSVQTMPHNNSWTSWRCVIS